MTEQELSEIEGFSAKLKDMAMIEHKINDEKSLSHILNQASQDTVRLLAEVRRLRGIVQSAVDAKDLWIPTNVNDENKGEAVALFNLLARMRQALAHNDEGQDDE